MNPFQNLVSAKEMKAALARRVGPRLRTRTLSGTVLKDLWIRILFQRKMSYAALESCISRFINAETAKNAKLPEHLRSKVPLKGNLTDELIHQPGMSMKALLRGMSITGLTHLKITFEYTDSRGQTGSVTHEVLLDRELTNELAQDPDVANAPQEAPHSR